MPTRYVASVVSGLSSYSGDWIGVRVADWVLEDVRMCMEICDPKFNQRRVSVIKFLGELYNYKLLDSNVVVKVSKTQSSYRFTLLVYHYFE